MSKLVAAFAAAITLLATHATATPAVATPAPAAEPPPPGHAHVIISRDDTGAYHATGRDGEIARAHAFSEVAQAALDSLTDDRTSMETVLVATDARLDEGDPGIRIPSYTTVDFAGVIEVTHPAVTPVSATHVSHVSIPRLTVKGTPAFGLLVRGASHVHLGDIRMNVTTRGVRIDDRSGRRLRTRSTDIRVDRVHVAMEGRGGHAFETFGVDRLHVGHVFGESTGQCVLLLNDTRDATIDSVIGRNAASGTGYATLRLANDNRNVSVGRVIARGGGRGVFILSGSRDVTVNAVNLADIEQQGIFIEDARNVHIAGGVIRNSDGAGVLVNSRSPGQGPGRDHPPAEGVSITNLRILDDRDEPRQPWGIDERGPATRHNRYVNNDLRGAGTQGRVRLYADTSVVRDNVAAGIAEGTVTLESGAEPAARVPAVSRHPRVDLRLRARLTETPPARIAWTHHFEYDPREQQWDLVIHWRHDPGEDVQVAYIIDQH